MSGQSKVIASPDEWRIFAALSGNHMRGEADRALSLTLDGQTAANCLRVPGARGYRPAVAQRFHGGRREHSCTEI